MTVLALVLGVALVASLVAAGMVRRRLQEARDEIARLEGELARRAAVKAPAPVKAAGLMVRTALETANRVRERGVGGMLLATAQDFTRWVTEDRTAIARVAGPDGSVTILFSDIEGSTRLNAELGDDRWVKLLAAHDAVVDRFVEKYAGHTVKKQGDGHMVVFASPAEALHAALGIQDALEGRQRTGPLRRTPLRVRIGLHTGPVVEKSGDFFGQNVARAARIAAEARGGEILVSDEVVEQADEGFGFEPADQVELKGFEGLHQLWRVQA